MFTALVRRGAPVLFALFTVILTVLLASAAHAQPTLTSIVIDGDFRDWQAVLVNPVNTTRDGDGSRLGCTGTGDLDCPVSSTGRDLRLFAWTHDSLYVYFYVVRQGSASNTENYWHYVDGNVNGLMETGEKVVRVRYSGSNRDTQTSVFRYIAVNPGGDPMVDAAGFADGYTLPGNLDPNATYTAETPDGGGASGTTFEARVPWSVLGIPAGTPMGFHVSSSNSPNPGNVASQIDDNLGSLGGGAGTFAHSAVTIAPESTVTVAGGATAAHAHRITNTGTKTESYSLQVSSTLALAVDLYQDTDGDGDGDVLIATDATGDGDFSDAGDSIAPGFDADGDGWPNTPVLAPGEHFDIVAVVTTRTNQRDVTDELTISAFLASDRDVMGSVVDRTDIGLVAVLIDQQRRTIVGQATSYPISACNNSVADTFDIDVQSTSGHAVTLSADAACDGTGDIVLARDTDGDGRWDSVLGGDSNGDGRPDTGMLATGACQCYVVTVDPGASALGDVDTVAVTVTGAASGATAHADLVTTIATRIELRPSYLQADGTAKFSGFGKSVFFPHVAVNNGPYEDDVLFAPGSNDQGWPVTIWSDPNGDGSIADGRVITRLDDIAPYGGTKAFVVEVETPSDRSAGSQSITTITAVSVRVPSDSASVTDEVQVSIIATYGDPLFAFATRFFGPCAEVFIELTSLERVHGNGRNAYELLIFDGGGTLVETIDPIIPDDLGIANVSHVLGGLEEAGVWRIELQQDGEIVSTFTFTVEPNGVFTTLATDRASYPLTGADLSITADLLNGNVEAPFGDTTLEYVVLDPAGLQYLEPGVPRSGFLPYDDTQVTRTVPLGPLAVAAILSDAFTSRRVDFPSQGIYSVRALWRAACGTVLAKQTISFTVGSGVEMCTNGLDDDGDTLIDCRDPECGLDAACKEQVCDDGVDNDGDGMVDCADPDCVGTASCPEVECNDGVDNDLDGLVDCDDPDCAVALACVEFLCGDGIDNDGDGFVDCADSDCAVLSICQPETECANNLDDDGDGATDCADTDCVYSPACISEDTDGDTIPNEQDCAPLDPGAHDVPAEVFPLMVTKAGPESRFAVLTWPDASAQAGDAVVYDVATGLISELWQDRGFRDLDADGQQIGCLVQGLTDPAVIDNRMPGERDGFYYLVLARNACGDSGWGQDSFGNERNVPSGLCGND